MDIRLAQNTYELLIAEKDFPIIFRNLQPTLSRHSLQLVPVHSITFIVFGEIFETFLGASCELYNNASYAVFSKILEIWKASCEIKYYSSKPGNLFKIIYTKFFVK